MKKRGALFHKSDRLRVVPKQASGVLLPSFVHVLLCLDWKSSNAEEQVAKELQRRIAAPL
jgi:hypothetical protein